MKSLTNGNNLSIGFIGGGNMASSLIGGLLADGISPTQITIAEPNPERRAQLRAHFAVKTVEDNRALVETSRVVVLAVKPQLIKPVCCEIQEVAQSLRPLFVSIAAGVRIKDIDRWLGCGSAIVRTMPNTPSLIQTGATAMFANAVVTAAQCERAESILRAVGLTLWVETEEALDAVTALSGSGPAYFFLVIELLQQAGESLGLKGETARLLALQTAFGAAKMALESNESCTTLRQRVTSPGGTTERALEILREGGLEALLTKAVTGARDRAQEMAEQLGAQ